MMNHKYLLVFVLLFSLSGYSQFKKEIREADNFFADQAYFDAIELYELQVDLPQQSLTNFADSYYYVYNYKKAAELYEILDVKFDGIGKDVLFRYADALKGKGDYARSDEILERYSNRDIHTLDFFRKLDYQVPFIFNTDSIQGSESYSDYGPTYVGDKVIFSSSRNINRPIYARTKEPFLDLYEGSIENDALVNVTLLPDMINTDEHEGNIAITADGNTMYFTRNNPKYKRIDLEKVAVLQIYKAEMVDGTWGNIEMVPFSSDVYSTMHPALSPSGKKLYFSSDMPGGFGEFDIYYVSITEDGNFGEPVNLGPMVNGRYREQFPYISKDGDLYFSSNRFTGLGGMDLYRSDKGDVGFGEAYNLGTTINSSADDISLTFKDDTNEGLFASNRTGQDMIYSFIAYDNEEYTYAGVVRDSVSGNILPMARVSLYEKASGILLADTVVNSSGIFSFPIRPNVAYELKGSKLEYFPKIKDISVAIGEPDTNEDLLLKARVTSLTIDLERIFFDFDKSNIRPDAAATLNTLVSILKKYPEFKIEVQSHTDSRGTDSYNMKLSQRRAESTVAYLVSQGIDASRLTAVGYGETVPFNNCNVTKDCTKEAWEQNRRSVFLITAGKEKYDLTVKQEEIPQEDK